MILWNQLLCLYGCECSAFGEMFVNCFLKKKLIFFWATITQVLEENNSSVPNALCKKYRVSLFKRGSLFCKILVSYGYRVWECLYSLFLSSAVSCACLCYVSLPLTHAVSSTSSISSSLIVTISPYSFSVGQGK